MLDPFLEGTTLPLALSDRRIFIVDHEILDGIPTKEGFVVCAPIALFFQSKDGSLVPIAIQLFQQQSEHNPIFLPTDPKYTWILAKMWFNNADAAVHQAAQHMCNTHLLIEGAYVITQRNLSQSHPIFKLLMPHILYIIPINVRAAERIMSHGGWVEKAMSIGIEGMQEIVSRQKSIWRMDTDGTLPANFRERGVEDFEILPQYYFREDAMMLYEVIRTYVLKYIKLYYETDDKIMHDDELRNWREEMVKPYTEGGLELHGVPGNHGHFVTKTDICDVLTWIIFTCSVGHASLNRKQYDEYAYPPNCPLLLRGVPPTDKEPRAEHDILDALPDKHTTVDTMTITHILSQSRGNPLGTFDVNFVYDPAAVRVVKEFREDLKKVSSTIKTRNRRRPVPYDVIDPDKVTNTMCI